MPRLMGFGDEHPEERGESWILRHQAGRDRVISLDRESVVLTANIVNWRRFEASGEGWSIVVSAERTVEAVDIELTIDGVRTSLIQNYLNGAHPKKSLVIRPEGARTAYVFPNSEIVFREPWRDSEMGKNIRAIVEFRPKVESTSQHAFLLLAAILYWTNLPYSSYSD